MVYALRQCLAHHTADVRAVMVISEHKFLSTSRDKSTILWETIDESHFFPMKILKGGEHFINCITTLPASQTHPNGVVVIGSQDNRILLYDNPQERPYLVCQGHQNAVFALCPLTKTTFASGSWDGTLRIWSIDRESCIGTYTDHTGAVLAILKLTDDLLLSASADKLINVYKLPEINRLRALSGHTDCVRALTALRDQQFLSCSNDGTIRRWNADTGVQIEVVHTCDAFIYSVAALDDSSLIVCGCENNQVIIIDEGKVQELMVPAISVWSVAIFPSSRDIVVGSSDGVIRLFSADTGRQASQAEQEQYNMLLMALGKQTYGATPTLDAATIQSLPGPEALTVPGKRNGQLLILAEGNQVFCYQWSTDSCTWILVGDVTGINPDGKAPNKKVTYEGVEYDFVFDVDVAEGQPPLKLPFSYGDNPYTVADEFLIKHNLPTTYKTDVVNFILKNVPATSSGTIEQVKSPSFVYAIDHFLVSKNIDFTKAKAKLIELTNDEPDQSWIDDLVDLARHDIIPSNDTIQKIEEALQWPPDNLFPILDLLRVAVTNSQPNIILCTDERINLLNLVRIHTETDSTLINTMLVIRLIGNMVIHGAGQKLALEHVNEFLDQCKGVASKGNKTPALEIALANFIVNITIINLKINNLNNLEELVNVGMHILERIRSKEAMCRITAGVGTAVLRMNHVKITSQEITCLENLTTQEENDDLSQKLGRMARDLLKIIKPKLTY